MSVPARDVRVRFSRCAGGGRLWPSRARSGCAVCRDLVLASRRLGQGSGACPIDNRNRLAVLQTQFVNLRFADLRYFVAVAEELSFTRAAARLYVAQQALSAQVRQLERELGVQLLERTTRRIQLTEAGVVFLRHARSLLAAADAAVDETRRAVGAGRLRIGFMAGAALELTH